MQGLPELWDVYDQHGQLTGRTRRRGEAFADGEYHLATSLWIAGGDGRLLIQQRSATKPTFPGIWNATGGAVLAGESSKQGCVREVWEELGIRVDETDLVLLERFVSKGLIFDDYLVKMDIPSSAFRFQTEEVAQVRWATRCEILALCSSGQFLFSDLAALTALLDKIEAMT